ncbi:MAG: hypothetical protein WD875_16800 [Pirellulales bacterium]
MKVILPLIAALTLLWLPLIVYLYARRRRQGGGASGYGGRHRHQNVVVALYCFAVAELGMVLMGRTTVALVLAVLAAIPLAMMFHSAKRSLPERSPSTSPLDGGNTAPKADE